MAPDLVTPETLLEVVESITKQNLHPIFPSSKQFLHILYEYVRVFTLPHSTLSFAIAIPLMGDPKVSLDLYEILTLPHPVKNNFTINYSNLPRFLAVSDDRTLFSELESLDTCRSYDSNYLCPITSPIYRNTAKSCALAHFLEQNQDTYCNKHFSSDTPNTQVVKTKAGWLFSSPTAVSLTISCPGGTRVIDLQRGSGVLSIKEFCKISAKDFILPASAHIESDTPITVEGNIQPFHLNWTEEELTAIDTMGDVPLLKDVLITVGDKMPLAALKSDLKNLQDIKRLRHIYTITSSTSLSLSSISFLASIFLVILVILYFWCSRKKSTSVYLTQQPPPGPSNTGTIRSNVSDTTLAGGQSINPAYRQETTVPFLRRVSQTFAKPPTAPPKPAPIVRFTPSTPTTPTEAFAEETEVTVYETTSHLIPDYPSVINNEETQALVSSQMTPVTLVRGQQIYQLNSPPPRKRNKETATQPEEYLSMTPEGEQGM